MKEIRAGSVGSFDGFSIGCKWEWRWKVLVWLGFGLGRDEDGGLDLAG